MKTYTSKMNKSVFITVAMALSVSAAASKVVVTPEQPVQLFPLRDVRLLESPFSEAIIAETSEITVDFSYIGIQDKAKVRDLWTRMDLGEFSDSFEQEIPLHGAGLFRISPTP